MDTGKVHKVYGWDVATIPVLNSNGETMYWLGMFDNQQIPTRFASDAAILAHAAMTIEQNIHPCN